MNVLAELRRRFAAALAPWVPDPAALAELAGMVRISQDPKFGDYQANCAMPLKQRLNRASRDIATDLVAALKVNDLCHPPEIAGPGFINLKLRDDFLAAQLNHALADPRLGIAATGSPGAAPRRRFVVDYSAPNVAKPMHVGHIRSTVIGDALSRTLRFAGHEVITDNHIGDWGTQFGMIIYGYKHFRDEGAYRANPVAELARLYKLVNRLVDYHDGRARLPELAQKLAAQESQLKTAAAEPLPTEKNALKKAQQALRRLETQVRETGEALTALRASLAAVEGDAALAGPLAAHPKIATAVLAETSKLHVGDAENLALWREFMPPCLEEIARIYRRLGVTFDHTLGESFYQDRLSGVVADLKKHGLARESDGAVCVFLDGFDIPMIIQKQDGAFLYATTDLATIQYRVSEWHPDAILYVVDHRQSLHFEHLFAAVQQWNKASHLWGDQNLELMHLRFGTVLGEDRRPIRTRSGESVALESLLDEAIRKAFDVVSTKDDAKPEGAELLADERRRIADVVGIAALKYADLAQNRESDYIFSYDKMLSLEGNTATYMQFAYARVRNIFAKGQIADAALAKLSAPVNLSQPTERALALELLRFSEALDACIADYRPNHLTAYLFELAGRYSNFYNECSVLQADDPATRDSRLRLCDLTARTLRQGLALLGIDVIERM
ncbi:MAG: arginine--tRNA ligase [Planctomycetia bacterium]|nr:arginine--tRNA ligase [Planctomycetia bacterium]